MTTFANIDQAAHSGANGHNSLPEATLKQRIAGNYLKGRLTLHGLRIAIESPRGTLRHWQAEDGASGTNLMKFHYGYIEATKGNDGDELDCSIGPAPEAMRAYVINQFIKGKFDEHKIMLGFPDKRTAMAGYLSNYDSGWQGLDSCIPCSITQLKWWIANGNMARPLTQDQLPFEGTDMDKVIWDGANNPLRSTLDQVLYNLRARDANDGLLFDSMSMADILADSDGVLAFDALVIPFARLEQRMGLLQKVIDRAGDAVKVAAMQVSDPFTQAGSTNVAVIYELSDGQTVSVFFHNPDVTPKKIMANDDLISWKWMLNKKDITVAVAPERGRDLDVRTVAARIMRLAEANSARFIAANGKRAEKLQVIAGLKDELATKEGELNGLLKQIEVFEVENESNPVAAPAFVPEAAPEPVAAVAGPDVDGIKAVITSDNPMPGVNVPAGWIIMNAPRPLLGQETLSNGEFLSGRWYAALDPQDYMTQAYIDNNVKMDASVVFVADKATLTAMALQTIGRYQATYLKMDEEHQATAISPFINKLNGKTYGELKALAALGMPVIAAPEPVVEVAPVIEPVAAVVPQDAPDQSGGQIQVPDGYQVITSEVIKKAYKFSKGDADAYLLPKEVKVWRVSAIKNKNGGIFGQVEMMKDNDFEKIDSHAADALGRIAPAIDKAVKLAYERAMNANGPSLFAEPAPAAPEFTLESETADEARLRIQHAEAVADAEKAQSAVDAKAERDAQTKKEIDARQAASADGFQLGQSAEDSLSGQTSILDVPAAKPSGSFYSNGDAVEYTGKTEMLHGALFYEFRYTEGRKIGEVGVTQRRPDGENPGQSGPGASTGIMTPQVPVSVIAPAAAPVLEFDPVKGAAEKFLQSIIEGVADMSYAGLSAELKGTYESYKGDADMLVMIKAAVKAYSAFAVAKAKAALAK